MTERPDPTQFAPVPVRRRRDGWTVEKQIRFIEILSQTGCATHAAAAVGMSVRSAYRLAARPDAREFAEAWDCAMAIAARALTALAWRYATEGVPEQVWKDGVLVSERRRPSERILIFLLANLDRSRFGARAAPLAEEEDSAPRSWPERRLGELFEEFADLPAEKDEDDKPAPKPRRARARAHRPRPS